MAIALLTALNLLGVAKLKRVEIGIVSANLLILVVLGTAGILDWSPDRLSPSGPSLVIWSAGIGAAAIFVAYEGFHS